MSLFARVWRGEDAAPTALPNLQTTRYSHALRIPPTPRQRRAPPDELLERLAQPASSDALRQHSPSWEG